MPRFTDDQLGLMDHFGGYCISGCFARKLMERAPARVAGAVFWQTVGYRHRHHAVRASLTLTGQVRVKGSIANFGRRR